MKKVVFAISSFSGGGAERVIGLLCEEMKRRGYQTVLLLTAQQPEEISGSVLPPKTEIVSLPKLLKTRKQFKIMSKCLMTRARFLQKISRVACKRDSDMASIFKYHARNFDRVSALKRYFARENVTDVIAFLNDPIFLVLLSAPRSVRIILSERNDPKQFEANRTTMAFIRCLYPQSHKMVFQSLAAMEWYQFRTNIDGIVIPNPLTRGLPTSDSEQHEKIVVNFCRISRQKNLILLLDAFARFHADFPDYRLEIIGSASGNDADGYSEELEVYRKTLPCRDAITFSPAMQNVHSYILNDAMFVSSSDFEGMSNSMLEAMAIGLPCICTDCPAGGARAIIRDHENGLLTPVGDAVALADAMKELAANPELAEKLSKNGQKLREELDATKIAGKWSDLL